MAEKTRLIGEPVDEPAPILILIARAKAGDSIAFDRIITAHQERVIALAWRMLGNQDDARDAAQESFLRVYRYLGKYDPSKDFYGWLYRIVINVCRDIARNRRHNAHASFEAEIEAGKLAEPAGTDDTEKAAIAAQEEAIIARALSTLSEKERAAIVLRDLEGLTTEEVARILGSSPGTVRSQISSARTKIKLFRDKLLKNQLRKK